MDPIMEWIINAAPTILVVIFLLIVLMRLLGLLTFPWERNGR